MKRPTLAEIKAWPATVAVEEAAAAIGCSRSQLYSLIQRGEAPVRVLPYGRRRAVVTASIVQLLEG